MPEPMDKETFEELIYPILCKVNSDNVEQILNGIGFLICLIRYKMHQPETKLEFMNILKRDFEEFLRVNASMWDDEGFEPFKVKKT